MKERCINKNCNTYYRYGERGITVCDRWLDFNNFLSDMGLKPTPKHTIDRYPDKKGNYEPSNCRWATSKQQSRNISTNRIIEYNGVTKILADWAAFLSINQSSLSYQLKRKTMSEIISYYEDKRDICFIFQQ